jgi:GTPase SAR1 family protein
LLVYSITDDTTFAKLDHVREEILRAQGGRRVPIFLVGTKADLKTDRAVSEKERQAKARTWDCQTFEVSSKTNEGVNEVFSAIVSAILAFSTDPSKGGAGGSVMGAGRTPATGPEGTAGAQQQYKKKPCIFF